MVCGITNTLSLASSMILSHGLLNLILPHEAPLGPDHPRLAGEDVEVGRKQRAGHLPGLLSEVQPPAVASSLARCRLRVPRDVAWRGGPVRPSVRPPQHWDRVHHLHCRASQVPPQSPDCQTARLIILLFSQGFYRSSGNNSKMAGESWSPRRLTTSRNCQALTSSSTALASEPTSLWGTTLCSLSEVR